MAPYTISHRDFDSYLDEVILIPFWIERVVDDARLDKMRRAELDVHEGVSDIFRVDQLGHPRLHIWQVGCGFYLQQ